MRAAATDTIAGAQSPSLSTAPCSASIEQWLQNTHNDGEADGEAGGEADGDGALCVWMAR